MASHTAKATAACLLTALKHPRFHAHLVTCDRCASRRRTRGIPRNGGRLKQPDPQVLMTISPISGGTPCAFGSSAAERVINRQQQPPAIRSVGYANVVVASVLAAAGVVDSSAAFWRSDPHTRRRLARFHSSSCRGPNTVSAEPVSRVLVSRGSPGTAEIRSVSRVIKTGLVAYAVRES